MTPRHCRRNCAKLSTCSWATDGVPGKCRLMVHIFSAGLNSARVLLLTDHTSGIDALLQEGRVRGVLEGLGRFRCRLSYVPVSEDVKVGDRVVTSGMERIFAFPLFSKAVKAMSRRKVSRTFPMETPIRWCRPGPGG